MTDPNELATCRTDLGSLTRKLLEQQQEIERLREQLRLANVDNFNTTAEVERLRAERDEVRQSYCSLMEAYRGGDGRVTANKLGWGYLFPRRPKKEDGK